MTDNMMTNSVVEIASQEATCPDPECRGVAEPDQDGDHIFYECQSCGYQFGWEKAPAPAITGDSEGSCSIGVPESVRRAAAKFSDNALDQLDKSTPVSITRKK